MLFYVDFISFFNLNDICCIKTIEKWSKKQISMNQKFSEIYSNSIKNPEEFWKNVSEDVFWFKKPTKILNLSLIHI